MCCVTAESGVSIIAITPFLLACNWVIYRNSGNSSCDVGYISPRPHPTLWKPGWGWYGSAPLIPSPSPLFGLFLQMRMHLSCRHCLHVWLLQLQPGRTLISLLGNKGNISQAWKQIQKRGRGLGAGWERGVLLSYLWWSECSIKFIERYHFLVVKTQPGKKIINHHYHWIAYPNHMSYDYIIPQLTSDLVSDNRFSYLQTKILRTFCEENMVFESLTFFSKQHEAKVHH